MHNSFFRDIRELVLCLGIEKRAEAAPRGHAKSTIGIIVASLWLECYHNWTDPETNRTVDRSYIGIFSDTATQAEQQLACVRAELEDNPKILEDFGERRGDVEGKPWKTNLLVTSSGLRFEAFGAGKRVRGRRHKHKRFDFMIFDDLENKESVESKDQRDKLWEWLTESAIPAGDLQRCSYLYLFTVLHEDAVGSRILRNPGWRRRRWRALITEPTNRNMWVKWEEILFTPPDDDGEDPIDIARLFYLDNQEAMDEGSEVLWEYDPLYRLMLMRAVEGEDAFWKEKQNDPSASGERPFATMQRWGGIPEEHPHSLATWVIAIDPSVGRREQSTTRRGAGRKRDPSAIVAVGLDEGGSLIELDSSIKVRDPDEMYSDAVAMYRAVIEAWSKRMPAPERAFDTVIVESNQAQQLFGDGLEKHCIEQHGMRLPIEPQHHSVDKDLRIRGMQPRSKHGIIMLRPGNSVLAHQVIQYPAAGHDDGPDALETGVAWLTSETRAPARVPDRLSRVRDGVEERAGHARAAFRAHTSVSPTRVGESQIDWSDRGIFSFGGRS